MAKNEPKEVRVNEIIQAAIEEFIEKGYDGASMDQIAKRAGVSKGGVYYHFPNKEVLLMMANEKISRFSLIRSMVDALGSGITPSCTAKRRQIWAGDT